MRVFVNGGSGFVGSHVISGLVAAGHEVSALARSDTSAAKVRALGATAVTGELGAVAVARLRGHDAVIHCAAYVEEWGTRADFWSANVDGTTQLLDASRAAGVSRFVHVGTEAALFDGHDLRDVDESHPYPARQRYLYSETKAEAERRVLAANVTGTFETISVRPRFVWGPRDTSVLPAILRMAKTGSFAWLDGGAALTSTCHVENLVHALVLALTRGTPGAAYFVADEGTLTIRAFLDALAGTQDVDLGSRSVPGAVARPLACVVEASYRLVGAKRTPPLTRFTAAMMSRTVTVRTDRARAELGYAPVVDVAAGLAELGAARGARSTVGP